MLLKKRYIPISIIIFLMLASLLDQTLPGMRYLKYLIIPICFVIAIQGKLRAFTPPGTRPFYVYLAFMIPYSYLLIGNQHTSAIDDAIFVLTYLLPLSVIRNKDIRIETLFILASTAFSVFFIGKIGSQTSFDIFNSSSSFEHGEFGFIFAFFLVYFVTKKQYRYAAIATILTVLTLKRIAIGGAAVALLIFFSNIDNILNRKALAIAAAIANIFIIFAIEFSITEQFNEFVVSLTGQSANQFMMGRVVLYRHILESTSINWFYGLGPGSVYSYASSAFDTANRVLLHSDVLKLSIEFGLIFIFIFFFFLYSDKRVPLELLALLNIIMLTDNPLIYAAVMFFFLMIVINKKENLTLSPPQQGTKIRLSKNIIPSHTKLTIHENTSTARQYI